MNVPNSSQLEYRNVPLADCPSDVGARERESSPKKRMRQEGDVKERRNPQQGKRSSMAGVWLDTDSEGLLRLPLSVDSHVSGVGGLVLSSLSGADKDEVAWETLDAVRWLMPSLAPELIAEVLGLHRATDSSEEGYA
jgi:hypothetical protein